MNFNSIEFVGLCICAMVLLRGSGSRTLRDWCLAGLNIYFVYSFSSGAIPLIPLLLFVALGYLALWVAKAKQSASALGAMLALLLLLFIWLKGYSFVAPLPSPSFPIATIGLSYILFRVIHLLVDVAQGALEVPKPLIYFNYMFFFLTFVSGPIQRFGEFAEQSTHPIVTKTSVEINSAIRRVIAGFLLIQLVCSLTATLKHGLTKHFLLSLEEGAIGRATVLFAGATFTQLIHLYANFAGYMSICIGVGLLVGYSLPENFRSPLRSQNFLDLWSRWHITLSEWFKFYIFNPILRKLVTRWGSSRGQYLGAMAFFVTFVLMGLWHGSTAVFVFYGLVLGIGVTVNKLWQIELARRFGRARYKALCQAQWYRRLSSAAAVSYFAVALTCVWLPDESVPVFARSGTAIVIVGAYAILLTSLYMGAWLIDLIILPVISCVPKFKAGNIARAAVTAFLFLVLINLLILFGAGAPEFVYKAF